MDDRGKKKLRILLVAEWFLPRPGGSELLAHNCALALNRHGFDVTVYTPSIPGDSAHDAAQPYRVSRSRAWGWIRARESYDHLIRSRLLRILSAILISCRLLVSRWDALIGVHIIPMAVPGTLLRLLGRRRIVLWALGEEIGVGTRSPLMRLQVRRAIASAEAMITISAATAGALRELGYPPERIVFQYPVPDAMFFGALAPDRAALRARFAPTLSPDGLLFVTVSRLVERKGVDTALRALAALRGRGKGNFLYLIAGDGVYRQRLEELSMELGLGDCVRFLGQCDEATKRDLIEAADLFLMPNRTLASGEHEGFGIVFLEAALRGTPSIGGRSGGTADAIAEGTSGWLVEPNTHEPLAERLESLLADPQMLVRMRPVARSWALETFTLHHEHRPLIATLERLA